MEKLKRDAPIYLNGVFTSLLVINREWGANEIVLLLLCSITFVWANNQKR